MRPVGEHRLLRYGVAPVVAAESTVLGTASISDLLLLTDDALRVKVLPSWDGSAGGGGFGGSRDVPLVPQSCIAA